ncbi:non-specific lipid transfer protein GPI-anchored 1 [Carex littledalei]|uniref:Non-specific lipid transfer protein GPI-anchored 1 n=1 Tax=Carex littledalei TaxID=544730 RepID=A0A833QIX6_9POAL|nr:non-specific lipid transfer protein GPI-anchored 1 [Carex littledalei]
MKLNINLSSLLLLSLLGFSLGADSTNPLQDKCSKEFEKLTMCLDYATAKVAEPGTTCCSAVSGIRQEEPACLCYIIQQAHSSSSSMASMGIKFDRLLSLPDSCKLANSSIANCPKLLNLSPSSPDSAIFTDPKSSKGTTKSTNSTSTSDSASTSTLTTTTNGTGRLHSRISIAISLVSAIFFSVL